MRFFTLKVGLKVRLYFIFEACLYPPYLVGPIFLALYSLYLVGPIFFASSFRSLDWRIVL